MILDFNADWRFYKADGSCRTVHLPHDAMLEEPRQENCQNGKDCGYFPGGKYAYEKTFSLPGEHLNEALTFLFEGVYQNAVVYLNGEKLPNTVTAIRNLPPMPPEKCVPGKTPCASRWITVWNPTAAGTRAAASTALCI